MLPTGVRVYVACGVTDMRKGFDGLAALIQTALELDPYGGALFVFRGKRVKSHPKPTPFSRPILTPPVARCWAFVPVAHRFVGRGAECRFRDKRRGAPDGPGGKQRAKLSRFRG